MEIDNLVHMANRIGEFFEAMPDGAEAREGITTHIRRYWEPRMRRALVEHVKTEQGAGLSPLVLQAIREVRAPLA